jgi:hypothetical protein
MASSPLPVHRPNPATQTSSPPAHRAASRRQAARRSRGAAHSRCCSPVADPGTSLLHDVGRRLVGARRTRLATSSPARSLPGEAPASSRASGDGSFWIGVHVSWWPSRWGSVPRSTSRSTRPDTGSPVHRREHPQPRRCAVGRLRDPRASPSSSRPRRSHRTARRRGRPASPSPSCAPDRDHHLGGGDPGRAQGHPRGRLRRGRHPWEVIRTTCCRTPRPASSPARCWRSPGRSGRRRR